MSTLSRLGRLPPAVHFALANLLRDRKRFIATLVGVAFAVLLMIFQGSLFLSFRAAGTLVVGKLGADIWMMPRGVACFECSAPMPLTVRDTLHFLSGVDWVEPVAMSFAVARINGVSRTLALVGSDRMRRRFMPGEAPADDAYAVDASVLGPLGLGSIPVALEINDRRARITHVAQGYGTFLIGPITFGSLEEVQRVTAMPQDSVSFIALKLQSGTDIEKAISTLCTRFPELDIFSTHDFVSRAANYWMLQSGAGAALALAGVLGFLVGIVIVSQTLYARTVENVDEYATLLAVGASPRFILHVIGIESAVSGAAGYMAGALMVTPLIVLARQVLVSWVYLYGGLLLSVALLTAVMCSVASLASVRLATQADPARVFRV